VSLSLSKGEIIAFTGLAGSGASELMQTMFGVLPSISGSIKVNNENIHGSINTFMKNGIGMLPSNRKENSVLPDMDILENIYIAEHCLSRTNPFVLKNKEIENYNKLKKMLSIKAEKYTDPIHSLSGGNQQKVFLGRWVNTEADVLLFDNPTQGVDVGAKAEIYKLILAFACKGKTVIINTLEIPEIKKVSDRCFVFFEGKVIKELSHNEINEHDVMLYSTNAINTQGVS
jgi:ribose transport system ATP-binding protein